MLHLTHSLKVWGTPAFPDVLKRELERLPASALPLQQGLSQSSVVSDSPVEVMIINVAEAGDEIWVKTGIFYRGVIAGCNCADDPTPVDELSEYCVVQVSINKNTAAAEVTLLQE